MDEHSQGRVGRPVAGTGSLHPSRQVAPRSLTRPRYLARHLGREKGRRVWLLKELPAVLVMALNIFHLPGGKKKKDSNI